MLPLRAEKVIQGLLRGQTHHEAVFVLFAISKPVGHFQYRFGLSYSLPVSGLESQAGNLYVGEHYNNRVQKFSPATTSISAETDILVDNTPPVLTVPDDVTVEQESPAGTVVPLTATATDNYDPSPVITSDELPVYPVGTTTVTFTATDASQNQSSGSMTVTVLGLTVQGPRDIKENVKESLSDSAGIWRSSRHCWRDELLRPSGQKQRCLLYTMTADLWAVC